jgi:hypothetical protein
MDKRIELEMRGRAPSEVTELNLDNCRSTQVVGLTDEFANLEILSLINVGLTTLKGFPNLPALKRLELSDNRLAGGLEHLSGCPNITHLNLSGNKIKEVDTLEPLASLQKLKTLDLFNCEVTQADDYRSKLFKTLSQLKYLDGFDRDDKEADESDEDGLGDDDEDDVDGEGDDDDGAEDEEAEDDEVGLAYLASDRALEDEDETGDFEPGEGDDDDDDDVNDDDEEDAGAARGTKRKHEDDSNQ